MHTLLDEPWFMVLGLLVIVETDRLAQFTREAKHQIWCGNYVYWLIHYLIRSSITGHERLLE